MKNLSFFALCLVAVFCLNLLSACQKNEANDGLDNIIPTETNNQNANGENDFAGGWSGNENDEVFYQDVMPFGNGNLPSQIDLTPYLPPVGNQGSKGTCVAWAAGYYAKTAMDAVDAQISGNQLNQDHHQASPKDLYWALPAQWKNPNCRGTHFEYIYQVLQGRGVASMETVPYENLGDCSDEPMPSWDSEAADRKIDSYRQLPLDVTALKSKLAENRPLVFGAFVSDAFHNWRSSATMLSQQILDGTQSSARGHAMTIIGYDDGRNAFRIVNSWGTQWGDEGFAWVDYGLMTNPNFTKYVFVAYNVPGGVTPPVNPGSNSNDLPNLVVKSLEDIDNEDEFDPLARRIIYDVKNTGNEDARSADDWSIVYLYYNAFNAEDFGVIVHKYISDEYGSVGSDGPLYDGLGMSNNWWYNINLAPGEELADEIFGGNYRLSTRFNMPIINGFYYLAMIVDPFEQVEESNESDNIFTLTGYNGDPIYFENGIGYGLTSGGVEDRSNDGEREFPNAYRPEEVQQLIKHLRETNKLLPSTMSSQNEKPQAYNN